MTCLEIEITRCYGKLRAKAIGITGSVEDGEDLLQDVLAQSIKSGNAERVACEQERKGSLFYYLYRAMYIYYRGQKQKEWNKGKVYLISIDKGADQGYYTDNYKGDQTLTPLNNRIAEEPDMVEYDLRGEQLDVMMNWISPYEKLLD